MFKRRNKLRHLEETRGSHSKIGTGFSVPSTWVLSRTRSGAGTRSQAQDFRACIISQAAKNGRRGTPLRSVSVEFTKQTCAMSASRIFRLVWKYRTCTPMQRWFERQKKQCCLSVMDSSVIRFSELCAKEKHSPNKVKPSTRISRYTIEEKPRIKLNW